jgi:AcrR family transcriptional regulator
MPLSRRCHRPRWVLPLTRVALPLIAHRLPGMAQRGSYVKGVRKREEILATALDFVATHGYSGTTIREIAKAVQLSPTGLLHYFGTKEQLFIEILRRRDARDERMRGLDPDGQGIAPVTDAGTSDLVAVLVDVVRHNSMVPGLVQLYVALSAEAADPAHPAHDYFRDRFARGRMRLAEGIRAAQQAGTVRTDVDADTLAALVVAAADGLQLQWSYDTSVDMGGRIARLTALLRP